MEDTRALGICYRLLSRMTPRAQAAAVEWLQQRLVADQKAAAKHERGMTGSDKAEFRHHVGQVALDLLALIKVTGGASGKRSAEFRGPINADVEVRVKPVAN